MVIDREAMLGLVDQVLNLHVVRKLQNLPSPSLPPSELEYLGVVNVGAPLHVLLPFSIARITAIVFGSFHPDHIGLRQIAPHSLSGQHLPINLQVPICYM